MPNVEGPLLDIIQLTREAIERVWWSGFWTGLTVGLVAGAIIGLILLAVVNSVLRK